AGDSRSPALFEIAGDGLPEMMRFRSMVALVLLAAAGAIGRLRSRATTLRQRSIVGVSRLAWSRQPFVSESVLARTSWSSAKRLHSGRFIGLAGVGKHDTRGGKPDSQPHDLAAGCERGSQPATFLGERVSTGRI